MGKPQRKYTPEFRRQMVELHRAGRSFNELSKEFGCTSWSIRQWVKQADRDAGRGDGGLATAEREELTRLRRENRRLREEREILSNVWSAPAEQGLFSSNDYKHVSRKCIRPTTGGASRSSGLDGKPHASSLIKRSVTLDRIDSQAFDASVNGCAIRKIRPRKTGAGFQEPSMQHAPGRACSPHSRTAPSSISGRSCWRAQRRRHVGGCVPQDRAAIGRAWISRASYDCIEPGRLG